MKLNKQHRESLLDKFKGIIESIDQVERTINKLDPKESELFEASYTMSLYLMEVQKLTIEKAIAENEIDY